MDRCPLPIAVLFLKYQLPAVKSEHHSVFRENWNLHLFSLAEWRVLWGSQLKISQVISRSGNSSLEKHTLIIYEQLPASVDEFMRAHTQQWKYCSVNMGLPLQIFMNPKGTGTALREALDCFCECLLSLQRWKKCRGLCKEIHNIGL